MRCVECGSVAVTERSDLTAHGYRRFRCRTCGKQFNERSGTVLNRAQYPSDVIALVVFWRLRYKLSLRDLPEMFALRGMVFSHEAAWLGTFIANEAASRRSRAASTAVREIGMDDDEIDDEDDDDEGLEAGCLH